MVAPACAQCAGVPRSLPGQLAVPAGRVAPRGEHPVSPLCPDCPYLVGSPFLDLRAPASLYTKPTRHRRGDRKPGPPGEAADGPGTRVTPYLKPTLHRPEAQVGLPNLPHVGPGKLADRDRPGSVRRHRFSAIGRRARLQAPKVRFAIETPGPGGNDRIAAVLPASPGVGGPLRQMSLEPLAAPMRKVAWTAPLRLRPKRKLDVAPDAVAEIGGPLRIAPGPLSGLVLGVPAWSADRPALHGRSVAAVLAWRPSNRTPPAGPPMSRPTCCGASTPAKASFGQSPSYRSARPRYAHGTPH